MASKKKKAVKRSAQAKKAKKASAGGRRSRYRGGPDDQTARIAAQLGATHEQIAAALNVSERTLSDWLSDFETLRAAVRAGKEMFDSGQVESSLLQRALGYESEEVTRELRETKEETPDGPLTTVALVETKRVRRQEPANVAAAIFWLCNRAPERWRQKQEHQVSISLPRLVIEKQYVKPEKPAS